MLYFGIAIGVMALAITLTLLLTRQRVVYEVRAFVTDEGGNLLLVYDQASRRMAVPSRRVAFDEIPTKALELLMAESYPTLCWQYDWRHHARNNKYDRVRDDVGPIYTYYIEKKVKKHCVLCYALQFGGTLPEGQKHEYPFPELFPPADIQVMSADIRPEEKTMHVIGQYLR